MARPGSVRVAVLNENARQLETALRANRRIKVKELSRLLNISVGIVYFIIYILPYHKIAAQWIPGLLSSKRIHVRRHYRI